MKILVVFLLVFMMVALPAIASAAPLDLTDATIEDLKAWQAQINERIAELEAAAAAASDVTSEHVTTTDPTLEVPIPALKKGDKSDDVKVLQQRLAELGYYTKKIDGDYGSGVVAAVKTFQSRNGLEQNGEANAETLAILFSDNVAKLPEPPALEITKVNVYKTYGSYHFTLDLKNNSEKDIDAFDIRIKAFNKYGDRVSAYNGNLYLSNAEYEAEYSVQSYQGKKIKAGASKKMSKSEEFDLYTYDGAVNVEVAITRYHTTDGETVNIPTNKWIWYSGDGAITYPVDDGYVEPVVTTEDIAEAEKYLLGFTSMTIYDYIAPMYGKPSGEYLDSVDEGPAEDAGLETGDIIISIDGVRLNFENAIRYVKAKMKPGETYEVVYYRKGEYYTTEITRPE